MSSNAFPRLEREYSDHLDSVERSVAESRYATMRALLVAAAEARGALQACARYTPPAIADRLLEIERALAAPMLFATEIVEDMRP